MTQATPSLVDSAFSTLLSQGKSTQPRHLRLPGQVEDSLNVFYSPSSGLRSRNGAVLVGEVTGFSLGGNVAVEPLSRGESERHVVIHGPGPSGYLVKVYDVSTWSERSVTIEPGAAAYLDPAGSASRVRVRTFGDVSFMLNRDAEPAVRASNDFDVFLTHRSFDELISYTPLASGSHHRTVEDAPSGAAGYWRHTDMGVSYPTMQMVHTATGDVDRIVPGEGSVPADYTSQAESRAGFDVAMRRVDLALSGVSWDQGSKTLTAAPGSFSGLTKATDPGVVDRARTQILVTAGTGITTGWHTIASIDSDTQVTLEPDIGPDAGDVATDGIRDEFTVVLGINFSFEDMHEVAALVQRELRFAGAQDALVGWLDLGGETGRFSISSTFRGDQAEIFPPTTPTTSQSGVIDLTDEASPLHPLAHARSISSRFTGSGTDDGTKLPPAARWIRVAAPLDSAAAIDDQTMPVLLTRLPTDPVTFSVSPTFWNSRTSGSEQSNPAPEPIRAGTPIADIAIVGGRLALAAGGDVMLSASGDLFNFFAADAFQTTDADPFTIGVTAQRSGRIQSLASAQNGVTVLLTSGLQFEVEDLESDRTVRVTATSAVRTFDVPAVRLGESLMLIGPAGGDVTLHEYRFSEGNGTFVAQDVSRHARGVIPQPGEIDSIWSSTSLLVTPGMSADFMVYHRAVEGQQRIQSAYAPCRLGSGAGQSKVVSVASLDDSVYMLVETASKLLVYRLPLSEPDFDPWSGQPGPGFVPLLDGAQAVQGVSLGGETSFPYAGDTSLVDRIITINGDVLTPDSPGWTANPSEIVVDGDFSFAAVVGSSVDVSVTLTPPVPRQAGFGSDLGQPIFGLRMVLSAVTLLFPEDMTADVSGLSVVVDRPDGLTDLVAVRSGPDDVPGSWRVYLRNWSELAPIRVVAVDARPIKVQSVWYEGEFVPRH